VYIFGEVDDNWNIGECGTPGETCDYRDEEDFLDGDVPEEVQEAMNCFELPAISISPTCEGQTATFGFPSSITGATSYQWQEKTNGTWVDRTADTTTSLSLPNVQLDMSGTRYRVIVRGKIGRAHV